MVWFGVLFLCSAFYSALSERQEQDDVAVVISALGGPDLDGEREDLSWIPRNLTKRVHIYHFTREISKPLYQRTKRTKLHFVGNTAGSDCLSYLKFIIAHYDDLPKGIIFLRADASLRCPSIRTILDKPSGELASLLEDTRRNIPGYMPLTRVLLNQSEPYLTAFNYPMVEFANQIILARCEYLRELADARGQTTDPCENFTLVDYYPKYITTFLSGNFFVSRENILQYPLSFYKTLYQKIFHGSANERTCGMLEYLWPVVWGGTPFQTVPDFDRPCGPMYQADLASELGFIFFESEDGSLEKTSTIPRGYYGYVLNPQKGKFPSGYRGYHGQQAIDRTDL